MPGANELGIVRLVSELGVAPPPVTNYIDNMLMRVLVFFSTLRLWLKSINYNAYRTTHDARSRHQP